MALPRFCRRQRVNWKCLTVTALLLGSVYFYFNFGNERTASVSDDKVLLFRKERFLKYQNSENDRTGPGEKGEGIQLQGEEKELADKLYEKEAFNIIVSDKISLERSVKDVRDQRCKSIEYPKVLPTASVVIIFHNEAWSPLLRTAHSVVNRSPPEYLHEVILLDDFSDRPELGPKLSKYVEDTWPDGVVKIVRTKERSGLIRARLAGAKAATGDVLIFLDSHCEAAPGWLEPLLARIKEDHTTVLCPEIDNIDKMTLTYGGTGSFSVGGFWWSLHFAWRPIPLHESQRRQSPTDPIRLEPLLARIKGDRTTVLCPEIDSINKMTLTYGGTGSFSVGGFWWSLHFAWRPIPLHESQRRQSPTDPIRIEPILARIKEDRSTVLCPIVDAIMDNTLEYSGNGGYQVGGFTWSLHFTWENVPERDKVSRLYTDPVRSPTMAGGLFAADRKYFFEIGAYDDGMDVWGGENLEISFRVWMCGGKLEFIPCSRVGHIFRSSHPYTFPGNKDTHGINSMRLAEVWMDEYKRLFYTHRRDLVNKDCGDLTARKELRKRLNCHSFKWFLDNVIPEKFIPDENVRAWGMVRNPSTNLCLDTLGKDEKTIFDVGVFSCQGGASASEVFSLSLKDHLRREDSCTSARGNNGDKLTLVPCSEIVTDQKWKHNKTDGTIIHVRSGKCLDVAGEKSGGDVRIKDCDKSDTQKWTFEHYLT